MKYFRKIVAPLLLVLLVSCTSDDENAPDRGVIVTTLDFNNTILENAEFGDVVGIIKGRTNIGLVSFEITSQTPEGALAIDEIVGELTVANPDVIDANTSPEIVLVVTVKNGDVSKTSNVTITVEPLIDDDGDGISFDEDPDDTDPCIPSQLPNYDGYDATNPIWMAGDCNGDGVSNGEEIVNGTNPYECLSTINVSIWSGSLSFTDEAFGFTNNHNSNPDTPPLAGCGSLTITDPLNFNSFLGPCPADSMLEITLRFTPASDGATDGTVTVPAQDLTCGFPLGTYSATGTYDELTETIILNYAMDDGFGFIINGVLTIIPTP